MQACKFYTQPLFASAASPSQNEFPSPTIFLSHTLFFFIFFFIYAYDDDDDVGKYSEEK